ncbi:hypothetical protein LCH21_01245 [Patescibacteria group bacterium]|nr:hypothetical protein [Patescibacteria group bacterium]
MKPRLVIQQKITAFVNKYKIYSSAPTGESDALMALAQQKRLAFKEKVMFYADEKRDKLSFTFRAEKVMDVHGRYFVEDASGKTLGMFKKEFMKSLVNSTWKVFDADGSERFEVKESNQILAIVRRFGGELPIIGLFVEIATAFFKYHFVFIDSSSGQVVGAYRKTTLLRDHYVLEIDDTAWESLDWRVFAGFGVALDALQSR